MWNTLAHTCMHDKWNETATTIATNITIIGMDKSMDRIDQVETQGRDGNMEAYGRWMVRWRKW